MELGNIRKFWLLAWSLGLGTCLLPRPACAQTRPDQGRFYPVDLSALRASAASNSPSLSFQALPAGSRVFGGVPFQIDGQLKVTGLDDARNGEFFPPRIESIPVGRKAASLHVLHGAVNDEKDGVPMASLIFRYANDEQRSVRLAYGVHARSWTAARAETKTNLFDPSSQLAWSGASGDPAQSDSPARLFQTAFVNPLPEHEIQSIEFVSLFSRSTPFIAGLTVESPGGPAAEALPGGLRRVARKAGELEDAAYRSEFIIRVKDSGDGQALTNAHAALSISDDEASYYFGEAFADAAGVVRLPYSPQQTVAFTALVRAPGHVPFVFSGSKTNGGDFAREVEAKLARGVRIAGIIHDPAGKPVAEAEVTVHKIASITPKEYLRIDHEVARTGSDGKWSSECVPDAFEGLSFQVSHPDYRSMVYTQAVSAAPNAVTRDDLLAGKAAMLLPLAFRVGGVVLADAGQPLGGAEIIVVDDGQLNRAKPLSCDAQGRFSIVLPQPGDISLLVRAKGYRPKLQPLTIGGGDSGSMTITLAKTEPFRGRVMDQNRQPVADAKIRLDSWNGSKLIQWQSSTDNDGRFAWDSPPDGSLMLYFSATNHSSTRMSFSNPSGEQTITIYKYSRIAGRVIDAETRKPVDEFLVIKGHTYNYDEPMRWERYDATRGRKGEYSVRLTDYSSSGRSQIMIEAPGYLPAASPPLTKAGVFTNDFELRKGRGINGVVQLPDGTPVTNAMLALVERSDNAYMEKPGELRRSGSSGEFQRSNAKGQFEFPPKLEPHTVLAASDLGFAEVRASNLIAAGRIVLRPWGRIKGSLRVGKGLESGQKVVLQSADWNYDAEGRTGAPLYLSIPVDLDANGDFVIEKVPYGERKVSLQFRVNDRENGRTAYSHGVPVTVKPGETAEAVIGGGGRTVIGRMTILGGEPEDVDWRRDIHTLRSQLSIPVAIAPPNIRPNMTQEEQQKEYRDYRERQTAFWQTDEGRALQRKQRQYALRFETNGTFRVENVEPGTYTLYVSLTNPDRPDNYYEHIGSMNATVTIPPPSANKADEPHDLGRHQVSVRGLQRTGRLAPKFETKTFDGKAVKLDDFKGKYVLIDFWATWAGSRNLDVQMLKSVHDMYGKDERFVLLGLNFDNEPKTAEDAITKGGFKWVQCYAGPFGDTSIASAYGIQGLPDNVLIDPEGKIRSRNLRGSSIRTTVRNILRDPVVPKSQP